MANILLPIFSSLALVELLFVDGLLQISMYGTTKQQHTVLSYEW
jgi:hypothetical protein